MEKENRKLKICHIITRMILGGAQENTLLTVIGHIEKGHDVVLVTGPSPGPEGELLKKRKHPDFEIIINSHLIRELNPFHDIAAYFSLKSFLKSRGFDVVHTHSSKAGIIGRAAAKSAGVPFIVHTVHGQPFHQYEGLCRNFFYRTAERWAAKRCNKIFAVSQAMIDQSVKAGIADRSKYKLVYSGMELESFLNEQPDYQFRERLGIPEKATVIGTIARLFPLKGYEYLVPAAEKITEKHPEVCFLVVGDGILKEELLQQILERRLNFVFAGLIPPDEIPRYTNIMDILVHLSLREGLPRAVVQALASGKPAVGFNLDGTPEVIINEKTGYLVEPKDVDGVADAVIRLLENREKAKKMGEDGRRLVSEKFAWQRMVDILEEEYLKGLNLYLK